MPSQNEAPGRYSLAPHARACAIDCQVIVLDLKHNRYMAVPHVHGLADAIVGWPKEKTTAPRAAADSRRLLSSIESKGLLTRDSFPAAGSTTLPSPSRSIESDDPAHIGRLVGVARLVSAASSAALSLRYCSLAAIVEEVGARRRRATLTAADPDLCRLSATYAGLRPWAFAQRDRCLLDSLALSRFLAYWRHAPAWVIGVKTRPFAAHSWLQSGTLVLNDRHEHVAQYQPILIV